MYITPAEVVTAQVNLVQDVLRGRFGRERGFGDAGVVVVDPAVGTGAYPLAIAGLVPSSGLGERMHLFEPRADAAMLAQRQLSEVLGEPITVQVRDTLAQPVPIDGPLVVCLGNPPYNRQVVERGQPTERKGGWVRFGRPRPILADFRAPDVGVHLKSLYNDYVYFWRWAVWAVCEQRRGPGVISLITASSFLRGPGFGGMRAWLRQHLDELWIVDLEGEGRGTRTSDNVFADVQTPIAITMGARYAVGREAGHVLFARCTGSRAEKLTRLSKVRGLADLAWAEVSGEHTAPLVPGSTSAYVRWPLLTDLFPRQFSGCQMKRRWPIAPSVEALRARWTHLLSLPAEQREQIFRPTRDRTTASSPGGLTPLRDLGASTACPETVRYAYRSFDRQWVLKDARLGDFMRPALWHIAGPRQVFLTTLLTHPLGAGPSAVATCLVPDLDHFRGSFGGKAVIPLWLDVAASEPNLARGLLDRLSAAYGTLVTPEQFFAYCYALLSTPAYQARFDDELRACGPRVPLTARAELFERAAGLGEVLLRWHLFDVSPRGAARELQAIQVERGYTYNGGYTYNEPSLLIGTGAVGPVRRDIWEFSVSGLRVVKSWLRYRLRGEAWSGQLTCELLELLWLLEATLDLQPALTAVLDDVVSSATLQV